MAINFNIERYGEQFNAFVNFANSNADNPDALARIDGVGPHELLDPNGQPRSIVAKNDGDKIKHFTKNLLFSRQDNQKALNTAVRNLFKETILNICGVDDVDSLPPAVLKAIKKSDFGNAGHPLSARRILAVKAAIDIAVQEEKIRAGVTAANRGDPVALSGALDAVMREARKDPDVMRLLAGNDCGVAQGLILTTNTRLVRPLADILRRFKAAKDNLEELRTATGANRRLFERLVANLGQMGGKAFPKGLIARIFELAQKTDISSLANISAESSMEEITKALCVFEKGIVQVDRELKPMATFKDELGGVGADIRQVFYHIVVATICDKCDEDTLRGIKAAMGTENAGKVLRGCEYLFGANILPRGIKPDLILHNAIKYTAFRVSLSGTTRMCMLASVNEILGVENEDNSPDVKKIGNRDLTTIYTVLEDFAKENVDLG